MPTNTNSDSHTLPSQNYCCVPSLYSQPSSECFDLFEDVMLLAAGRVIYHNKVKALPKYLRAMGHACPRNYNPADFVIFLMQQQSTAGIQALADAWEGSETKRSRVKSSVSMDVEEGGGAALKVIKAEAGDAADAAASSVSPAAKSGCCTQFSMLLKRECQNTLRDKGTYCVFDF